MNEIVNKLLLTGNKLMPEITYSACGSFKKKNKERIQKLKETVDTQYIYQTN